MTGRHGRAKVGSPGRVKGRRTGAPRRAAALLAWLQRCSSVERRTEMGASAGAGGATTGLLADQDFGAALVDTVQTLVCVLDRDGRIVRFNRACERATRFTSAEVVGRDARETVIPPGERQAFSLVLGRIRETRAPSPERCHWATRDGGRRLIAWTNRPLLDEDGEVAFVVTSGLDVTERETATTELWALQGQLRDRVEELQRLAAEQAALRRVATLVAREASPDAVFAMVTEEAGRLLGADSGLLLCYSDDHRTGRIVGRFSDVETSAFALGTELPVEGNSLTRTVLETGKAGRIDSYEGVSGEIARRVRESQYHSVVAAPVVVSGRVWGLLVAATQRPEPLAAGAERRLESFAELVAVALASAEARNELAASRARIVEAADDARRRLERDLHDGAQQRLVAVALGMRLARARIAQDPDGAAGRLDEAAEHLEQGLEQLRELARGIHPALLTERGLGPALGALADRAPFPVEIA